jgi:hypothetical protein
LAARRSVEFSPLKWTRFAICSAKVALRVSSGHENQHVSLVFMGMAQRVGVEAKDGDWMRAHAALSRLAKARALADAEEGRWLLAARRAAAHVHLGFGSFAEYIERLFGYTVAAPDTEQEWLGLV